MLKKKGKKGAEDGERKEGVSPGGILKPHLTRVSLLGRHGSPLHQDKAQPLPSIKPLCIWALWLTFFLQTQGPTPSPSGPAFPWMAPDRSHLQASVCVPPLPRGLFHPVHAASTSLSTAVGGLPQEPQHPEPHAAPALPVLPPPQGSALHQGCTCCLPGAVWQRCKGADPRGRDLNPGFTTYELGDPESYLTSLFSGSSHWDNNRTRFIKLL